MQTNAPGFRVFLPDSNNRARVTVLAKGSEMMRGSELESSVKSHTRKDEHKNAERNRPDAATASSVKKSVKKNGERRVERHRIDYFPYLLFAPVLVILLVFFAFPMIRLLMLSVQSGKILRINEVNKFVGFKHFIYIFTHSRYLNQFYHTLVYVIGCVVGSYVLGLATALLLNESFRGRTAARVLVVMPWAISLTVTCLSWIWIMDFQWGILNVMLQEIGIIKEPIGWLHKRQWAMFSVILVTTWRTYPFTGLMLLAGLQNIPNYLYDAAEIDGAGAFRKFWYVTIPQLRSVSNVVLLILSIWSLRRISYVMMLTGGGPNRATEVLALGIYDTAFKGFEFGRASALSVVMVFITILYVLFYLKVTGKTEI